MFPIYIHTVRGLDNSKNTKHQGLAKVLPYYKSDAKSEKSKHIAIITGIKKDIELNLGNIDSSSEIYRLFYLEKKNEIIKRWQGEFGENVFKRKPENFKINWADLDDWNQTQNRAVETNTLDSFNRIVFTARRLYFYTTLAFNYDQMDGPYGNFVPSFALPKWQFNWGLKPEAQIKLYGQTLPGYAAIPNDYVRNIKIGSLHLWQAPRLLLPTPKIRRIRAAYAKQLDQVSQNFLFYNLFKLQIYKFWRHDSFGEGQAKRRSKIRRLAWWNKRPKFHYKPSFFHLIPGQFYKNRPFYERFNSIHAFAQKIVTKHMYLLANEQLTLEKQSLAAPFPLVLRIAHSFTNLFVKFPNLKNYYSDLEFCTKSSQILKFTFVIPTVRQRLVLISPMLERHWPRITISRSKQFFPKYMKNKSRHAFATSTYKARTQLQWLGERLGNRFEKLYGYFLKTVLLLIVAHQKLVGLTALNMPKFEPIVNMLAVGLIRRQKLSQNVRITFNNLFKRLGSNNKNKLQKQKCFKFPTVPTQLFNAFLDSNNLEIIKADNHYNFDRNLVALETLVPVELLPLLAFIGTHSLTTRIPFEMNTKDFKALRFDANLYRHFISSVGFRYYYADRLSSALRTSLQSKSTLELNGSRTLLIGPINTKLLVDNLWLRGRWKINFYRELVRQRIQKRRRSNLLLST